MSRFYSSIKASEATKLIDGICPECGRDYRFPADEVPEVCESDDCPGAVEISFKICDFCEEEAEELRYAELRWPGGAQRGYACPGCLGDDAIDIYEMPR